MKKDCGCVKNHLMRGGGTTTFTSPAGIVQPGFYPEIKAIDSCSVARPGMIQVSPKGLMGGRRRSMRKHSRHHSNRRTMRGGNCGCSTSLPKLFGGSYKMDLVGQGMQPNQFAEIIKMPCDGQKGGAPFIEMPSVGYGNKGELIVAEGGNVVPVMSQQPYNNTLGLSSACVKTGGRMLFRKKYVKNTKKAKKSKKSKKTSRKH
jgi:hypothetical protein